MATGAASSPPPPLLLQSLRVAAAADSSPSSAESTFRELDDVFLQTQTRIWLGEVLRTRLDEELTISELLSDGELLFEVSRVIWEMLLATRMELGHSKAQKYDPFDSQKGSGRYMPYCNVDSFLKLCKILGLNGIDLFSPSDVVEKKNTRKVCICIRLLSKKARSKHLDVPDFDIVTYTPSMPTYMVGCIKRSLELSHYSLSDPSSYSSPRPDHRTKSRQKHSIAASAKNYDGNSEDSYNVKSHLIQSDGSYTSCSYDTSCQMDSSLIDSPEVSSMDAHPDLKNDFLILNALNQETDAHRNGRSESLCSNISADSLYSQHMRYNYQDAAHPHLSAHPSIKDEGWDCTKPQRSYAPHGSESSSVIDNETGANYEEGYAFGLNNTVNIYEHRYGSRYSDDYLEVSSVSSTNSVSGPLHIDDLYNGPDTGECLEEDVKLPGVGRQKGHPGKSHLVVEAGDTGYRDCAIFHAGKGEDKGSPTDPDKLNADNSQFEDLLPYDQPYSAFEFHRVDQKYEDEVTAISTDCEEDESSLTYVSEAGSCPVPHTPPSKADENILLMDEAKRTAYAEELSKTVVKSDSAGTDQRNSSAWIVSVSNGNTSPELVIDSDSRNQGVMFQGIDGTLKQDLYESTHSSKVEYSENVVKNSHQVNSSGTENTDWVLYQDDKKPRKLDVLTTENDKQKEDLLSVGAAKEKTEKRPLLKAIVRGTAVLSVMFLVLQFRKSRRDKRSESTTSNQQQKTGVRRLPMQKARKEGPQKGVYPAEKLKL